MLLHVDTTERRFLQVLVSVCCGELDRGISEDGADFSDISICPRCRMKTVFVEDKDEHK
jgi:hypothetical protein